jgi:hypothetical protein
MGQDGGISLCYSPEFVETPSTTELAGVGKSVSRDQSARLSSSLPVTDG